MKRKIGGYIFIHKIGDHNGTHIHVYDGDTELGVYDRQTAQPTRGLERHWNRTMREAIEEIENELGD